MIFTDIISGTLFTDIISGILSGLVYALMSSVFVIFLSMIFKYFTNETFPWFISTAIGLGIVGISGGLLAILDEPTPLSMTRILVATLVLVWATNQGDKLATLLPKKKMHLGMINRQNHLAFKVPDERDIVDIPGKPRVGLAVKKELAGKEFLLPADIPKEDIVNRLRRRLLADWGLGDAELELDQQGRFAFFAISAREQGLSGDLKEDSVAVPMTCHAIPIGLASGDIVMAYSGNDVLLESAEVKGVNEANKTVTVIVGKEDLQKCIGKEVTQIIVLPAIGRKLMVNEIMTRNVRTVTPRASVAEAISLMGRHRIGCVVVVEEDKPIGILTDGDVLQQIEKNHTNINSTEVKSWMTHPTVEISPNSSVEEAIAIMRNRNVKKLLVASQGSLVGIVTNNDIFRASSFMS
jgi:CBS domain-containing protein